MYIPKLKQEHCQDQLQKQLNILFVQNIVKYPTIVQRGQHSVNKKILFKKPVYIFSNNLRTPTSAENVLISKFNNQELDIYS